jgi:hypothetical protein
LTGSLPTSNVHSFGERANQWLVEQHAVGLHRSER